MSDDLTIADVLSRNVSIEWFEAVAVVRDVVERLIDPALSGIVPELNEIRLTPAGRVELDGRTRRDEPVRRLAQLLQALAVRSDAPVQLRLLISKATAPEPAFESVGAFGEALAYFERPQRTTILTRLHLRATAAAPATDAAAATLDTLAPLPSSDRPSVERRRRTHRREWQVAAGAALVSVACAGGVQYARAHGVARDARARVSAAVDRASSVVGSAVLSGASHVSDLLGLGRLVPAESPVPKGPVAATPAPASPAAPRSPQAPPQSTGTRRLVPALRAEQMVIQAFDLEPAVPSPLSASAAATIDSAMADAAPHAVDRQPEPVALVVEDPTYSEGSPGVTPPVAIWPRLPRELPPSMRMDDLSRLELIIDVDGVVESAKLAGTAPTVPEGMLVSVAKAWRFQPATKNGMRVRYRKTIWIAQP